jgi:hypothetical protein
MIRILFVKIELLVIVEDLCKFITLRAVEVLIVNSETIMS